MKQAFILTLFLTTIFSCQQTDAIDNEEKEIINVLNEKTWKIYHLNEIIPGLEISVPKEYKVLCINQNITIKKNDDQNLNISQGKISLKSEKIKALANENLSNLNFLTHTANELIYKASYNREGRVYNDYFYFSNINIGKYEFYGKSDILNWYHPYSKTDIEIFSRILKTLKLNTSVQINIEQIQEKKLDISLSSDYSKIFNLAEFNNKLNISLPPSAKADIKNEEVLIRLSDKKTITIAKEYSPIEASLKYLRILEANEDWSHLKIHHINKNELIYSLRYDKAKDNVDYYGVYALKMIEGEPYSITGGGPMSVLLSFPLEKPDPFYREECKNILALFRELTIN